MPAPRSFLLRLLACLTALAFLTTACGGDDGGDDEDAAAGTDDPGDATADDQDDDQDDDDGTSDLADPCGLISLADLEAAFGFAWAEGEATPLQAGSVQCVWNDADEAMPVRIVSLAVGTDDTFGEAFDQTAEQLYEGTKAFVEEADILEDDLGLGDDSYRTEGGIFVLDGDTYYSFTTVGGVSEEAVAGLKAMAAKVVDG